MRTRRRDEGFTLVELLISISILTVVIGAITTAMIVYYNISRSTMERDDHSGGADVAATYLDRDLASADSISTGGTTCSGKTNVFSLKWNEWTASAGAPSPSPGASDYTVAYRIASDTTSTPVGGGARYQLERWYCPVGGSTTSTVLVDNLTSASPLAVSTAAITGCGASPAKVTLARYTGDAGDDYSFSGCIGGRKR